MESTEMPRRRGRPRKHPSPINDGPLQGNEIPESFVHSTETGEIRSGPLPDLTIVRAQIGPGLTIETTAHNLAQLLSPEEDHETVIRRKAVALGLCDLTTAGALELAELEEMVNEAQAAGLDRPPPAPAGDAAGIVRELLEQLSVRSANGLPMTGVCKRCEMMPEHLKRDCVCRRARTWLETVNAGA